MASHSNTTSNTINYNEMQEHKSNDDCWIAVHSKVYDVTGFLGEHPGGSSIILKYAGEDATAAYDEVHAPGILEETLSKENYKGLLNQTDIMKSQVQRNDVDKTVDVAEQSSNTKAYQKPDLYRLISLQDFEEVAQQALTPKAWAFYSSAATDLLTHRANSEFFRRIMFRPRVMRNIAMSSMKRSILGFLSEAPFFVSPAAMARLAHPDGEVALAKGCANQGIIQCISSNASYPLASIIDAGCSDQNFFFQLYVNAEREKTAQLLRKARQLGVKAIFITVDAHVAGKREADERVAAENVSSPVSGALAGNDKKGGGMGRLMGQYIDRTLNWDDVAWIKETSQLPIVIKGIQCAADAQKALEVGAQGIMLSNHGGRCLDTVQPSILTLLELHRICPGIFSRLEVYLDGGIRRGSDILKALCLGATAVGVGRPYLYSLTYGQEGVELLTEILKDELQTSMKLAGITDLDQAHPGLVNTRGVDYLVERDVEHEWIQWKPKARM